MNNTETAIFGGGCFWCTEAVFQRLKGVSSVMPGYAGGEKPDPDYMQVTGGQTGHAEVIKVDYDPSKISYKDLLTVFFASHDPTTYNRQGADVGSQYRSIILYTTEEQKENAEAFISELNLAESKVVTEVAPLDRFYAAEDYHRSYYKKNSEAPYCQIVINPKIEKLEARFKELLK